MFAVERIVPSNKDSLLSVHLPLEKRYVRVQGTKLYSKKVVFYKIEHNKMIQTNLDKLPS